MPAPRNYCIFGPQGPERGARGSGAPERDSLALVSSSPAGGRWESLGESGEVEEVRNSGRVNLGILEGGLGAPFWRLGQWSLGPPKETRRGSRGETMGLSRRGDGWSGVNRGGDLRLFRRGLEALFGDSGWVGGDIKNIILI